MESKPREGETIFTHPTPEKGLESIIHREVIPLNNEKTRNPIKKWAKDLNIHFFKDGTQVATKHMKRCSTSFVIREMQVKTASRSHFTPTGMVVMTINGHERADEDGQTLKPSYMASGKPVWPLRSYTYSSHRTQNFHFSVPAGEN